MQLAMVKKDLKINTSYLKENVSLKNNFFYSFLNTNISKALTKPSYKNKLKSKV